MHTRIKQAYAKRSIDQCNYLIEPVMRVKFGMLPSCIGKNNMQPQGLSA